MSNEFVRCSFAFVLLLIVSPYIAAAQPSFHDGDIGLWAARNYNSWDNPLQSEVIINGTTVDIISSDTFEPIGSQLKPGWNDITLKTTPQEPASRDNDLIFRIGPMHTDPHDSSQFIMDPVIWQFRNGTDWHFSNGTYSNPLGPDVKEVTLNYHVYWAGLVHEGGKLKAGDYVLQCQPQYSGWNSPVVATVFVNGTPLNSFLLAARELVITPLLKPGKNEIRVVSDRVKNSLRDNDIEGQVAGPAEWYADRNQYMLTPITSFKAKQGWTKEAKSGQLINPTDPNANEIEHTIAFMVKSMPQSSAPQSPATGDVHGAP